MVTQDNIPIILGMALLAYLVGSINLSAIAARLVGAGDIRKQGSGNAGATNLFRATGPHVALPVLFLDIGKAVAVILLGGWYGVKELAPLMALPLILGNLYPVFHRFKGGKGVATATGAVLAISWSTMLLGGAIFLLIFGVVRRVSAGSIAMAISWPFWIWMVSGTGYEIVAAAALSMIIALSHRANICRLLKGEEKRFTFRSESPR